MEDKRLDNSISVMAGSHIMLSSEPFNGEKYEEFKKNSKYSIDEKSFVMNNILTTYDFISDVFTARMKKCIKNGINDFGSISDTEYELLVEEFSEIKDIKLNNNNIDTQADFEKAAIEFFAKRGIKL